MLLLFILLGAATAVAPAVICWRPRYAPAWAAVPLASGLWLAWWISQPEREAAWNWAAGLGVRFSFTADGLGLLFAWLICGIGVLVFLYAGSYLEGDPRLGRFYAYLTLFFASMLGLVLADNVLLLFIFWELTSLSSFLLIGYDHERLEARNAALQTLLVTGLGGLALLAGLILLAVLAGSYELSALIARGADLRTEPLFAPAMILVIAGAMTKSAQFPFHFWLPSAMEAPAPVSAYLHSATMVKAGVYLLVRLTPIGAGSWLWEIVAGVGLITMLAGFLLALPQRDAKRLLAFSTVGALGMFTMMIGLGTAEAVHAALALLLAHAFYKASLFLMAGAFEHASGTRNVGEWRGLWRSMPAPAAAAALAAASLAGVPPLFGYVAKEQALEVVLGHPVHAGILLAGFAAAGACAAALAFVLVVRPLGGFPAEVHAPGLLLWAPPALLALLGALAGLSPGAVDHWWIQPAAQSAARTPVNSHLSLWHGFNAVILVSLGILVAGALLYWWLGVVSAMASRLRIVARYGPLKVYEATLSGVNWLAVQTTRLLQSGKLRNYLLIVLLTTSSLAFHALISRGGLNLQTDWKGLQPHEGVLAGAIAAAAVAALVLPSRLAAVAALGVVGLGVAVIFLLYGAPDLAMTQFVVEALTVMLLVLVLYHLPRFSGFSSRRARLRDLGVSLAAGSLLTLSLLGLNGIEGDRSLREYYTANSYTAAHGRNVVNVILVDFRALDTLGEITVLAIAALGVFSLLKLRLKGGGGR
ncbi:MAG: hydrogen gas-evolving membrane-bound hydrogenase subunit E [Bryobacteraceae bacterium]